MSPSRGNDVNTSLQRYRPFEVVTTARDPLRRGADVDVDMKSLGRWKVVFWNLRDMARLSGSVRVFSGDVRSQAQNDWNFGGYLSDDVHFGTTVDGVTDVEVAPHLVSILSFNC